MPCSALFPPDTLVTHHIIQHLHACLSLLKTVLTHTQLQLQPLLLESETLLLLLVNVQSGHNAVMTHDLCLQGVVTNATNHGVNHVSSGLVMVEHPNGTISDSLGSFLTLDWCGMQFSSVICTIECNMANDVGVSSHVDLDEAGWYWSPEFVSDGERYEVIPNIVDKALQRLEWHHSLSWRCAHVSRRLRGWY